MRDLLSDLKRWRAAGKTEFAIATIVETRGSSLRPPGTRMLLNAEGDITGSVSSGCVDGDAVAEMEFILRGEADIRRPFFGISDEQAWGAGLACGGAIDVLVERYDPLYDNIIVELEAQRPVGFATRIDAARAGTPRHLLRKADGSALGSLGDAAFDAAVLNDLEAVWPGPHAQKRAYPQGEVFMEVFPQPPTLLIFGATDIAVPLAQLGKITGYEVIVSDARRSFLREERFPGVETRFGWPQDVFTAADFGPGWGIVVLFHDPKFDIPALTLALQSKASYIGFLGSKKTQGDRRVTLLQAGFSEDDLTRIHGPVGLDIGGKEPALIALSILAEAVAVRHRRSGGMMNRRG